MRKTELKLINPVEFCCICPRRAGVTFCWRTKSYQKCADVLRFCAFCTFSATTELYTLKHI